MKFLLDVTHIQLAMTLMQLSSVFEQLKATHVYTLLALEYNKLKVPVLQIVSQKSGLDSNSIAQELLTVKGLEIDIHALRMALMRYYRQGLLKRERHGGLFLYIVSERGLQRLRWLESGAMGKAKEEAF